jgi:hypothetical protein
MALDLLTQALRDSKPLDHLRQTNDKVGTIVYAKCHTESYQRNGINAAKSLPGTKTITFAASLAPKGRVSVFIVANCERIEIDLFNSLTTPQALPVMLANYINGVAAPGLIATSPVDLQGYSAIPTVPANPNAVSIVGPPGVNFDIEFGGFGVAIGGVTNPPVPTVTTVAAAVCAGKLYYGDVVVTNAQLNAQAYQDTAKPPGLLTEYGKIVMAPTGAATEQLGGILINPDLGNDFNALRGLDCCDTTPCEEDGVDCCECAHYFALCCHDQEIRVKLENFTPGTASALSLRGLPVFFRITATAAQRRGRVSVKLVAGADATRRPLANAAFEAVVSDVIDAARGIVTIKVQPIPV